MLIDFRQAHFLKSAPNLAQCPPDVGIEVAFVGRSNAGKSSAINAITGQNSLARTSKTPGRTQLINFFELDDSRRLVDLPGYGYASVDSKIKAQIQSILSTYLSQRACLHGLVLMMDIRHPLTLYDRQLLEFTLNLERPVHILLTKCDKLNRGPANNVLVTVRDTLSTYGGQISVQTFSALKNIGIDQARDVLMQWFSFD